MIFMGFFCARGLREPLTEDQLVHAIEVALLGGCQESVRGRIGRASRVVEIGRLWQNFVFLRGEREGSLAQ